MTDWFVLNGNPAPGDPARIRSAGVAECNRIADTADRARLELERIKDKFTSSIWVGETAVQFSNSLPNVIDDLRKLGQGYGNVADALQSYASQLGDLQGESVTTLDKARTADNDIRVKTNELAKAETFRDHLRSHRDSTEVQVRSREAAVRSLGLQRLVLQNQRKSATDPAQVAAIDLSISQNAQRFGVAQSQHRDAVNMLVNAERDLDDAVSDVRTISGKLSDGKDRLKAARIQANQIGDHHKTNALRAASAIRQAKGTALGSDWEKVQHRIKQNPAVQLVAGSLGGVGAVVQSVFNNLDMVADVMGYAAFVLNAIAFLGAGTLATSAGFLAGPIGWAALVLSAFVLIGNLLSNKKTVTEKIIDAGVFVFKITLGSKLGPGGKLLLSGIKPAQDFLKIEVNAIREVNRAICFSKTVSDTTSKVSSKITESSKQLISVGQELLQTGGKVLQKVVTISKPWKLSLSLW